MGCRHCEKAPSVDMCDRVEHEAQRVDKACAEAYEAMSFCLEEAERDWRLCQDECRKLQECYEQIQKERSIQRRHANNTP